MLHWFAATLEILSFSRIFSVASNMAQGDYSILDNFAPHTVYLEKETSTFRARGIYVMECRETGCHEAVRIKNIDIDTLSRLDEHFSSTTLNHMIDLAIAIKSKVFRGDGGIRLFYRGGRVARLDLEASVNNDEGNQTREKKPA